MGEVSSVAEVHAEDLVIRLEESGIDSTVCLGTRVWLYVGKLTVKQFTGSEPIASITAGMVKFSDAIISR